MSVDAGRALSALKMLEWALQGSGLPIPKAAKKGASAPRATAPGGTKDTTPWHIWQDEVGLGAIRAGVAAEYVNTKETYGRLHLWYQAGESMKDATDMLVEFGKGWALTQRAKGDQRVLAEARRGSEPAAEERDESKGAADEPQDGSGGGACPDGKEPSVLEAAIVADALALIDADPMMPAASKVRVNLRSGRKYVRAFWSSLRTPDDGHGSIVYFVEKATGQVYRAKSAKKVGEPMDRVIDLCEPTAAPKVVDSEKPEKPARPPRVPRKRAGVLPPFKVLPLTPQKVLGVLGMPTALHTRRERRSGVEARKRSKWAVSVSWMDWEDEGEEVRRERFDEAIRRLEAAGYGFHMLSGETGAEAIAQGRRSGAILVHHRPVASEGSAEPEHRPTPTRENHPDLGLRDLAPGHRVSIEGKAYAVTSAGGGSSTLHLKSGRGSGPMLYTLKNERNGRIARLRVPGVVARERDDGSAFAGSVVATFGAKSFFGDARTVYNPCVERLPKEVSSKGAPSPARPAAKRASAVGLPKGTKLASAPRFSSWGGKLALVYRVDGGFEPSKMERTYSVRFAVDHRGKKRLTAVARYVGVEPHILNSRVPYEETGFTIGRHGERLEGTFAPLEEFTVRFTLRGLTDREHGELARDLMRREYVDATDYRFGRAKWQKLLGQRFTAIQAAKDVDAANEVDRLVVEFASNNGLSDAAADGAWSDIARRGLYATTKQGRIKFIIHPAEQEQSREEAASAAAEEAPVEEAPKPPAPKPARGRRETEHQRERRERAERKADHLERKAGGQWESARAVTDGIPPGQPILVGHHSEGRHRRTLERSDRKMRAAIETTEAAKAARWSARGAGRSISSDDPDAIEALEAQVVELEASREHSKAINKAFRKGGWDAVEQLGTVHPRVLVALKQSMERTPWIKKPLDLTNTSANIRRIKNRIVELAAAAERPAAPNIVGDGFEIEEDSGENRIRFTFDARPDKATITKMKRAGFRWSRANGAWQRHLNTQGRHAAERMAKELFGWERPSAAESEEDKRAAERQARTKAEHAAMLERRDKLPADPPRGPEPESIEWLRQRAQITAEDRERHAPDVVEEAEACGERPEWVLRLREMSRREEEDMGRKLRAGAREEEASYAAERAGVGGAESASDAAMGRVDDVLESLTAGTQEPRGRQIRIDGPELASEHRTPDAAAFRKALGVLVEAAVRLPTKASRTLVRQEVSAHLTKARRHSNRLAKRYGAGAEAVRDAREVRDLLEQARAEIAEGL